MKNYIDDANNWGSYFKYSLIGEEGNELINVLKVIIRSKKQTKQYLFPSTTMNSLCLFVSEFLSLRLGSCKLVVRGSERKSSMDTTKLIETLLLSWILFLLRTWTPGDSSGVVLFWLTPLLRDRYLHDYQALREGSNIGKWRSINEINQNIFSLKTSAVVFLLWKLSPRSILMMSTRMSKKVARILLMDFKITTGIQVIKSNWNGDSCLCSQEKLM